MKNPSIPTDRLSIISALIILNYALMPFIYSPAIPINLSILGINFDFQLQYADLMVLSASSFAAIGTYWLIYDHPNMKRSDTLIHLILPTLAAGAMSIPLNVISIGPAWWVVFALVSILIIFMGFIVWDLAKKSKAGRFGSFILFFVLGLGVAAFIIKSVVIGLIESGAL